MMFNRMKAPAQDFLLVPAEPNNVDILREKSRTTADREDEERERKLVCLL
jgi:hypothetical protein